MNIRPVKVWNPDLRWEERDDGTTLIWRDDELAAFPRHLSERLFHWAETAPDRTWMAERGPDGEWVRVSYSQLAGLVKSVAQGLIDLGLSKDRPVMVLSGNSLKHAILVLAAQHVGIPTAAISTAYSLASDNYEKLESIVEQIPPGAVFVESVAPFEKAIAASIPKDAIVISPDGNIASHHFVSWERLIDTKPTEAVDDLHKQLGPDTVAKFLFTSGTTGSPKAVIQTQRMLCANQQQVLDCYAYFEEEPPVLVDWAPWNHTASGNKVFNMAVYNGGTYYIDAGKPSPAGMAETIRNLKEISPTWYFNVPVGYEMLLEAMEDDEELRTTFFRDLKMAMYAGAGLSERIWTQLKATAVKTIGQEVLLATGLGSTETAPFSLYCTEPQENPGNIGIPAQGVEMKLVPTAGKLEARLKGPNITPGYWRDEKNTKAAFDEEGFYCLGDALRFVDPKDPRKGFLFDGRIAENFKLATGTWVAVGSVRAQLNDALEGLTRDVVVAGAERNQLAAFLIPFRPAIERLVPGGEGMDDLQLLRHPALHAKLTELMSAYGAKVSGSSRRVARVMFLETPLELSKGELTEKGSVNQRAVLNNYEDQIEILYSDDPRVVVAKK